MCWRSADYRAEYTLCVNDIFKQFADFAYKWYVNAYSKPYSWCAQYRLYLHWSAFQYKTDLSFQNLNAFSQVG